MSNLEIALAIVVLGLVVAQVCSIIRHIPCLSVEATILPVGWQIVEAQGKYYPICQRENYRFSISTDLIVNRGYDGILNCCGHKTYRKAAIAACDFTKLDNTLQEQLTYPPKKP